MHNNKTYSNYKLEDERLIIPLTTPFPYLSYFNIHLFKNRYLQGVSASTEIMMD